MSTVTRTSSTTDAAAASPISKLTNAVSQMSTGSVYEASPGPPCVVATMMSNDSQEIDEAQQQHDQRARASAAGW